MKFSKSFLLPALFVLAACSTTITQKELAILEVNEPEVKTCKLLGDVKGASIVGGVYQDTGLSNAKNEALVAAGKLNATHIVWTALTKGYAGANVQGKAYLCQK